MLTMVNGETHIRIGRENYSWLESMKIHPRQSFDEVLSYVKEKIEVE